MEGKNSAFLKKAWLILKLGKSYCLVYSKDTNSKKGISQFKEWFDNIPVDKENTQEREEPDVDLKDFPSVETELPHENIDGLLPNDN